MSANASSHVGAQAPSGLDLSHNARMGANPYQPPDRCHFVRSWEYGHSEGTKYAECQVMVDGIKEPQWVTVFLTDLDYDKVQSLKTAKPLVDAAAVWKQLNNILKTAISARYAFEDMQFEASHKSSQPQKIDELTISRPKEHDEEDGNLGDITVKSKGRDLTHQLADHIWKTYKSSIEDKSDKSLSSTIDKLAKGLYDQQGDLDMKLGKTSKENAIDNYYFQLLLTSQVGKKAIATIESDLKQMDAKVAAQGDVKEKKGVVDQEALEERRESLKAQQEKLTPILEKLKQIRDQRRKWEGKYAASMFSPEAGKVAHPKDDSKGNSKDAPDGPDDFPAPSPSQSPSSTARPPPPPSTSPPPPPGSQTLTAKEVEALVSQRLATERQTYQEECKAIEDKYRESLRLADENYQRLLKLNQGNIDERIRDAVSAKEKEQESQRLLYEQRLQHAQALHQVKLEAQEKEVKRLAAELKAKEEQAAAIVPSADDKRTQEMLAKLQNQLETLQAQTENDRRERERLLTGAKQSSEEAITQRIQEAIDRLNKEHQERMQRWQQEYASKIEAVGKMPNKDDWLAAINNQKQQLTEFIETQKKHFESALKDIKDSLTIQIDALKQQQQKVNEARQKDIQTEIDKNEGLYQRKTEELQKVFEKEKEELIDRYKRELQELSDRAQQKQTQLKESYEQQLSEHSDLAERSRIALAAQRLSFENVKSQLDTKYQKDLAEQEATLTARLTAAESEHKTAMAQLRELLVKENANWQQRLSEAMATLKTQHDEATHRLTATHANELKVLTEKASALEASLKKMQAHIASREHDLNEAIDREDILINARQQDAALIDKLTAALAKAEKAAAEEEAKEAPPEDQQEKGKGADPAAKSPKRFGAEEFIRLKTKVLSLENINDADIEQIARMTPEQMRDLQASFRSQGISGIKKYFQLCARIQSRAAGAPTQQQEAVQAGIHFNKLQDELNLLQDKLQESAKTLEQLTDNDEHWREKYREQRFQLQQMQLDLKLAVESSQSSSKSKDDMHAQLEKERDAFRQERARLVAFYEDRVNTLERLKDTLKDAQQTAQDALKHREDTARHLAAMKKDKDELLAKLHDLQHPKDAASAGSEEALRQKDLTIAELQTRVEESDIAIAAMNDTGVYYIREVEILEAQLREQTATLEAMRQELAALKKNP